MHPLQLSHNLLTWKRLPAGDHDADVDAELPSVPSWEAQWHHRRVRMHELSERIHNGGRWLGLGGAVRLRLWKLLERADLRELWERRDDGRGWSDACQPVQLQRRTRPRL